MTREELLVSIGLPVFNGEEFLEQALTALLTQDFPYFELIISDNASQDRTEGICREFASHDPRIRYVRQSENRGAPWNFAFVLTEAQGEYFMWAGHDDLWHPTHLRKCLAKLDEHPDAVLCCTEINFIDREGRPSTAYPNYRNLDTLGMTPVQRIHELISLPGWFATYGLMRRKMIPPLPSGPRLYGWDVIHLLEMSLLGPFAKVRERLFSFRILANCKTAQDYWDIFKSPLPPPSAPYATLATHLLETVYQSALSPSEKTQVYADLILACQNPPWRASIVQELLGPSVSVDDSQFALLLGMVLNRCVPLDELKRNPLSACVYRSVLVRKAPSLDAAASNVLDLARESRFDSYEEKRRRAASLYQGGQLEEAARLLEETLREQETSGGWTDWATVQLARERERIAQVQAGLRRAISLDPGNFQAYLKLGLILAAAGKPQEAIPCLELGMAAVSPEQRGDVVQLLKDCRGRVASRVRDSGRPTGQN